MTKTAKQDQTVAVKVTQAITLERLSDLLCCALEGGSNYWYVITKFIKPKKLVFRTDEETVFRHLDYPLNEGGALLIGSKVDAYESEGLSGDEADKYIEKHAKRLDLETIRVGAQVYADKYPASFARFIDENDDANDGDLFLQCCLYGEALYG